MPFISVFDWSLYTTSLSQSWLEVSTHGNDPAQTGSNPYNPSLPTWTGIDFTFNGGSASVLEINDDDGLFQDGYVDTGVAQTLASDITINGVDYFAGDSVELEFSLLDAGGTEAFVVRIDGVNIGFAYMHGEAPTPGQVFNANDTRDGAGADSLDQVTPSEEAYGNILCFEVGTRIEAETGPVPVEALSVGDRVLTLDHGLQPVRWVRQETHRWGPGPDKTKPVRFRAGSLGPGIPERDLVVSAQHRMLVPYPWDNSGALCPSVGLTRLAGVRQLDGRRRAELIHLLFDRHEIVLADGAPAESFYPGRVAMEGLPPRLRKEVRAVLTAGPGGVPAMAPARRFLNVAVARSRFIGRRGLWSLTDLALLGGDEGMALAAE